MFMQAMWKIFMRSGREDIDQKLQVNFDSFFLFKCLLGAVDFPLLCTTILLDVFSYSNWFSMHSIACVTFTPTVLLW